MRIKSLIRIIIVIAFSAIVYIAWNRGRTPKPIKVGILHSLSGTMAISEIAVAKSTLLAIAELNEKGGVLGRQIVPILVDCKSDVDLFAQEAERLITQEKVSAIFGCWTSASRKRVKKVVEKHNNILFYPIQYEGLEQSPNIVYMGSVPNQQIMPAVSWCCKKFGSRFFLVGSDYLFPRAANEIIKDQAEMLDAEIVGEEYILLGSSDVKEIIAQIKESKPDVIFNTINGSSNIDFFVELAKAGLKPEEFPVMSFSIAENEIATSKEMQQVMAGHYACWNYFQSIKNPINQEFVANFKEKYGDDKVTSSSIEAGYIGVHLWVQAVNTAKSFDTNAVMNSIKKQDCLAPGGRVWVDLYNNHLWKNISIGRARTDGQFDVVWKTSNPIQPIVYPSYRLKEEWNSLLTGLYSIWNGRWENPSQSKELVEKGAEVAISLLNTLAESSEMKAELKLLNEKNSSMTMAQVLQIDREWAELDDDSPLINDLMNSKITKKIKLLMINNSQFAEVFVTDARGLNVAMSNKVSDYFQADEDWWKDVVQAKGVILGDVQYDKSAHTWGLGVYMPIVDDKNDVSGVIKAIILVK